MVKLQMRQHLHMVWKETDELKIAEKLQKQCFKNQKITRIFQGILQGRIAEKLQISGNCRKEVDMHIRT